MQKLYWVNFYKSRRTRKPSDFARFIKFIFKKNLTLVDLGCGNGRDSYYLGKRYKVLGVDFAVLNRLKGRTRFQKTDINDYLAKKCTSDIVYCRFLFHAIQPETLHRILDWTKDVLVAEFRAEGDKPKEFYDHERNFINSSEILKLLLDKGFKISYFYRGRGMAKYKSEDPLVIRIIARK